MEYIDSFKVLSQDIYKLPKLSKEDICLKTHSDYEKIILCGFYEHYEILDTYDIDALNTFGINNDIYNFGKNLLMIAAHYNKIRLIKYLLARGIDINISNKSGYNAYLFYFSNPNIKIKVLKLFKTAKLLGTKDYNTNNPFIIYMSNCHFNQKIRILEYLKSIDMNIYKFTKWGTNACYYSNNVKILKYLDSIGFNIFYYNKDYNDNFYSCIIKYSDQRDKNTFRLLKYLKSRGVRTYYSENYKYCKRLGYYKTLKYLLISNSNNRFKNITCYI
jgi:hypothetical protein